MGTMTFRRLLLGACALAITTFSLTTGAGVAAAVPDTIVDYGPTGNVTEAVHDITFHSDDPTAIFQCKIGEAGYSPCSSPFHMDTSGVPGMNEFFIRALSSSGVDPTPAMVKWRYLPFFAPPVIEFSQPNDSVTKIKLSKFKRLSGMAYSSSAINQYRVSLRRYVRGDEDARDELNNKVCTHIHMKTGKRVRRDCFDRPFARLKGGQEWRYTFPKRVRKALRPGRYTIEIRAFNEAGSAGKIWRPIRLTR